MSTDTTDDRPHCPELLAPAGGRAQLEAAVWAGADAVYFGLDRGLNARVRATSFAEDALGATMDYLHERGVRGYLTLNTLVFDEELAAAEGLIRAAASAGVDALIVQDIGLLRLARATAPNLALHASTQMSITDAAGVAYAAQLAVRRVVLGRELSIDEIAAVTAACAIETEVFVHGALCVSYSGQCFSSEAWGGRSANRGQCAQACRLPYGLLVDGESRAQGDHRYLLSPQDLMGLPLLPRLLRAGVHSLKIEGRLKGPDYVLATVGAYREALDRLGPARDAAAAPADRYPVDTATRRRLAQVFSRGQDASADGLTPGFLEGPQHQALVIGRNPRHRGVLVGEVATLTGRGVEVALTGPVKRGDGVVFDRGRPEAKEAGGNVYDVRDVQGRALEGETDQGHVELRFGHGFDLAQVGVGDLIWRTRDPAQIDGSTLDPRRGRRVPVDLDIEGRVGAPLRLRLADRDGHAVEVAGTAALQAATGQPLDQGRVAQAIGQLGDTPFAIATLECALGDTPAFLPSSEIKGMRRQAVEALLAERRRHHGGEGLAECAQLPGLLPDPEPVQETPPYRMSLLCRTREQVAAALAVSGIDELVLDFLEVHGLKEACAMVREAGRTLVVAAPRVFKPGEQRLWQYLCRLSPDALLVRSTGLLWELQRSGGRGAPVDAAGTRIPPIRGDFSLNAANIPAARHLLEQGLERLTLTHDLDAAQIAALVRGLPAHDRTRIEVIAHHHLPIFHTEYCVFARALSNGNSYRDCGRPCEHHRVHLRDPAGGDHLVLADIGCRNTVFNAAAQSAAAVLGALRTAGVERFRIELVDEPAAQVAEIVAGYLAALDGRIDAAALTRRLAGVTDANGQAQGVGLGSLAVRGEVARDAMKRPTAR